MGRLASEVIRWYGMSPRLISPHGPRPSVGSGFPVTTPLDRTESLPPIILQTVCLYQWFGVYDTVRRVLGPRNRQVRHCHYSKILPAPTDLGDQHLAGYLIGSACRSLAVTMVVRLLLGRVMRKVRA